MSRALTITFDEVFFPYRQQDTQEMCNLDIFFAYDFKYEDIFRRTGACLTNLPEFNFCDHKETNGICGRKSSHG